MKCDWGHEKSEYSKQINSGWENEKPCENEAVYRCTAKNTEFKPFRCNIHKHSNIGCCELLSLIDYVKIALDPNQGGLRQ